MKHHPLTIYQRQFNSWRLPAALIALLCGVLWWFAPSLLPAETADLVSWALLSGAAAAALLCVYAFIAPRLAYVECQPKFLCVSTPFYRLAVSYSRIRTVRPVKFAPAERGGLRRDLAGPFFGHTAVVVDLNGYPVSERWLRFWLGWFMFPDNLTGLQFITPDWMALSRDIDTQRAEWKVRRTTRR